MSTGTTDARPVPPHPERFYIRTRLGTFHPVEGHSVTVAGMEHLDLFYHETLARCFHVDTAETTPCYGISGGKTGTLLHSSCDPDEAALILTTAAKYSGCAGMAEQIIRGVEVVGLSPRWQTDEPQESTR